MTPAAIACLLPLICEVSHWRSGHISHLCRWRFAVPAAGQPAMADMFLVQHAFKALPAGGSVSLATRSVQGASTAYSITPGASAAPAYLKTG